VYSQHEPQNAQWAHCNALLHTASHRITLHQESEKTRRACVWVYSTKRVPQVVFRSRHPRRHRESHCNTLQHTATHCNTPQHPTSHYRTRALQECLKWCLDLGIHVVNVSHPATHCHTLQHTATPCSTLQNTCASRVSQVFFGSRHPCFTRESPCNTSAATHCNTLHHTATPCSTLQNMCVSRVSDVLPVSRPATHCCNTLQHIATHCNTVQHTAEHARFQGVWGGV